MVELHGLRVRKKSRSRVTLAWIGVALFLSSFGLWGLIVWLALPSWSALVVAVVFFLGVFLEVGLGLSNTTGVKRIDLSRRQVDQLTMWMQSGEVLTEMENLSQGQVLRLAEMTQKLLGTYPLRTWTDGYGKTRMFKLPKVGLKVQVAGYDHDQPVFSVILYRRDLATERGIRRPWRITMRSELSRPFNARSNEVELPSWIG